MSIVAFRNNWPHVGMVLISKCYSHNSNVITSLAETHAFTHTHTHIYMLFNKELCVERAIGFLDL